MYISKIVIENFRLLESVELSLEKQSTVIVGRNNSGKTSLTELFRRLLEEESPRFKLEDFSLGVHDQFWTAFQLHQNGEEEERIRTSLPIIKTKLIVEYGEDRGEFGSLRNFIIDLNLDCTKAQINIVYELQEGKIQALFDGLEQEKLSFFKAMKERVPKLFKIKVVAEDPNDPTNIKETEFSNVRALIQSGFINAQRTLDDTSHPEKAVLGRIIESLFKAATSETATRDDRNTVEALQKAVLSIQNDIDSNFNEQLIKLIPTFNLFGYPGLSDPNLCTETILRVEQLLSNHTTIGYTCPNINLPESYNGLGPRNLIFILLKLVEFFRSDIIKQPTPGIHLVFIEEPEAHLHPQMQNVFIRKLSEVVSLFAEEYNQGNPWSVQFIVTTHSSHIANEATFDSMRYFFVHPREDSPGILTTIVKDLRTGLTEETNENREFLHKYMTLTRCDLLFADRCILIEGTSERLLLPKMIEKVDANQPDGEKLGSQYLSIVEVGGAYAHIFFNLLDFLNLRTLIITDLDTIDQNNQGRKCKVSTGTHSSNSCINSWFAADSGEKPSKDEIFRRGEADKIIQNRRLAFEIPHTNGDACGRSLEDAFMLANPDLFEISGTSPLEKEEQTWAIVQTINKTDFALKHAIDENNWIVPLYIDEGLKWLAENSTTAQTPEPTEGVEHD